MIMGQVLERTRAHGERLDGLAIRMESLERTISLTSLGVVKLEEQIGGAVRWAKGICIFIVGIASLVWTVGKIMGRW